MPKVLITEYIDPVGPALLEAAGWQVVQADRSEEIIAREIVDADAVIVRICEMPGELLARCPKLKIVSKHGVGYDNIDVAAAGKLGIAVTLTPGANSTSVAEHAFTLLMALAKHLTYTCAEYKRIGFAAKNCPPGTEITGKTLGIIGCGHIGSRIARMAHFGFGMKVLAYDPYLTAAPEGVELVSDRDRVFRESDFVTLHPVLNDETRNSVGAREFALMKQGAIFINCGRGPLIDEEALIAALQSGHLGGAGLDVTAKEPCEPDSPLFQMDNVLLTPHFAPTTTESAIAVSRMAAQNILDLSAGKAVEGRII